MTHRIARLCWLLVLFANAALAAEKGEPDPPEWVTKAFENRR